MKSKKILFTLIILLFVLCLLCVRNIFFLNETERSGITVEGAPSSYEYDIDGGQQIIVLKSSDLSITGKAQTDTKVVLKENVSSVKICDLNQGDNKIIIYTENNVKPCQLIFYGSNNICAINNEGDMSINCTENTAQLVLSAGVYSDNNLLFNSGDISAGYIISYGTVEIRGKTRLAIQRAQHEGISADTARQELWWARVHTGHLIVDLEEEGNVTILGGEYEPLFADTIEFSKSTKIVEPVGAQIMETYICDKDGNDAINVFLEYNGHQ